MVNPIDFGGHSSNVKVTMGIIDKGVYMVSVVKWPLFSTQPYLFAFYDFIK